jgi:hypothetical protein
MVSRWAFVAAGVLMLTLPLQAEREVPRTPEGWPDFQGTWTNATLTPMERPASVGGRATLNEAEAAAYEKQAADNINADRKGRDPEQDLHCGGTNRFADCGAELARVGGAKRTSLIVEPEDGRAPEFRPEARAAAEERMRPASRFDSVKDRPLPERCLAGFESSAGPPMIPGFYNRNYQIVQTADYLMILVEMVHDVRIIRIGGTHAGPAAKQWLGDSVGRWEGNSLVVETVNFTDKTRFRGSSEKLRVVERFTRTSDGILYRVTIDDPTTFVRPWTMEYPFVETAGPVYEYSCHEGNEREMQGILGGGNR